MAKKRVYKKGAPGSEYDAYHGTPEQKKRRAERNRDRAAAEKAGRVRDGDGREVDHVNAPRKGSLARSATRVISKTANRKKQPKRS
jgi:hypothetical protein